MHMAQSTQVISFSCVLFYFLKAVFAKSILRAIPFFKKIRYNSTIPGKKEVICTVRKLIEHMLEDLSTKDVFLFRIRCGTCGREYANRPTKFSKAGVTPQSAEKRILFDAIYEQELRSARHSAIQKAAEYVNYCPVCKQLVCNQCFLICEELDMCRICAAQLKEPGIPVFPDVLETAM